MDATANLERRRIETLLTVAELHATGVPLAELRELLPHDADVAVGAVPAWLADAGWTVSGNRLFRNPDLAQLHDPGRAERGTRLLVVARDMVERTLRPVTTLVRTIAVTGSVAFGEPRDGDDCDFLVITRPGGVWPFLLFTYLAVRFRRRERRGPGEPSSWCFNFVLDEAAAEAAYRRPSGFQFAREALTVRPIRGDAYYRELVGRAGWMRSEIPRLFDRWTEPSTAASEPAPAPPSLAMRLVNLALFPCVATYLQLVALRDNAEIRSRGGEGEAFEIVTRPDRLEVRSLKFARLAEIYESA